jgi:hypothetical protein
VPFTSGKSNFRTLRPIIRFDVAGDRQAMSPVASLFAGVCLNDTQSANNVVYRFAECLQ